MNTISKAICAQDSESQVQIACKVVGVKVFFTPRTVMATLLLLDKDGKTIEVRSWSAKKSYYVYFNFPTNETVHLTCFPDCISDDVDKRYSQANFCTTDSSWFLHDTKQVMTLSRFLPEFTDIQNFHKSQQQAKSLVGMFVSMGGRGPLKFDDERKILARGIFIKLRDANNLIFSALVWSINRRKFRLSLDGYRPGDIVLLPHAREQAEQYRSRSIYTVTTTYQPVVNPRTIDLPKVANSLRSAANNNAEKNYYPY